MLKSVFSFVALAVTLSAAAEHKGIVFADSNANGVMDPGERPLKGVKVTDGLNVVETDRNGNFILPGHEGERFIYITTPSGFMTDNGHWRKIDNNDSVYSFGLIPYNPRIYKDGSHRFIHLTDTEIFNTTGNELWVKNIHDYSTSEPISFVIHTGDICYEKGLKEHIGLLNAKTAGVPVFYCIGNHDLVKGKYGEELFESIYGPSYYSFDVAGTHYVVTPMAGGDHKPGYTKDGVAAWLENDLAHVKPGTPVIVFNHDILSYTPEFVYGGKNKSVNLNDHNLKANIYGHWHNNIIRRQGDVMTACTSTLDKGGIDHSTSAYRVFTVDRNGAVKSDIRYSYMNDKVTIASPVGLTASRRIAVNAYSSVSPVKSVTYSISRDGRLIVKNARLSRQTDWTWTASLPSKAETGGKCEIDITVTYNDGRKSTAKSEFTYNPAAFRIEYGQDWTTLGGNAAHNGADLTLPVDSTLSLAWTANVGGNLYMASPVIHGGKIYVATVDENAVGESAVVCLDGKTGSELWRYPTEGSVKNSIAYDSGLIFAQDVFGNLYALNADNGSLAWRDKLPVRALPCLIEGLTAADGRVFAGTGEGLSCYESSTGKFVWRNKEWRQNEGATMTLAADDDIVVGGTQWGALYANDAKNGKKLWSRSDHGLRNRGASAALHDGLIYIISDRSVFVIDGKSGRIITRREMPFSVDATSTPLLTEGLLIFGTASEGLVALDSETLEEKWRCATDDALVYTVPYTRPVSATIETSPVSTGKLVFVCASDGKIYGVDKKTGRKVWSHYAGAPMFSSVAVSGNVLVATDFGGNVYAFSTPQP